MARNKKWTIKEDKILRKHYGSSTARNLAQRLDRTIPAITARVAQLKIRKTVKNVGKLCSRKGCKAPARSWGFCKKHADQYYRGKTSKHQKERRHKWERENIEHLKTYKSNYWQQNKKRITKERKIKRANMKKQDRIAEKQYTRKWQQKQQHLALSIYNNECSTCGEKDRYCLQWHHRKGRRKKDEVGYKVARNIVKLGHKNSDIMLLCANCHIKQDAKDGTRCYGDYSHLPRRQRKQREALNRRKMKAKNIYGNKCQSCSYSDTDVLQWHHRNGNQGERNEQVVGKICREGTRLDNIVLLCANCHIKQDLIDRTNSRGCLLWNDRT